MFRPFDLGKWFKLGFCAWLATFVEMNSGGGGSGGNWEQESSNQDFGEVVGNARSWIDENMELIITIGGIGLLVVVGLVILTTWLGSRGRFMFLDGVVHNRGAVAKPWNEFVALGNSLFRFQLVLSLSSFLFFLLAIGAGLAMAWDDILQERFEEAAIGGAILGGVLLFLLMLGVGFVNLFTRDFVVPTMYARNLYVSDAWEVVRREVLGAHTGTVLLYCLMKLVLSFCIAFVVLAAVLLTCCVMAIPLMIPYLSTVMLLPTFVFMRSYSLYFLEQFGGPWRLIQGEDEPPVEPSWS